MLELLEPHAKSSLFVAVPDQVADWTTTLELYQHWNQKVAAYGYPRALVIQNGATSEVIPWDDCEAIFIGGTTDWKLGPMAAQISHVAKTKNKHLHMGRVNSLRRLMYANSIGCDSADGTFLKFGPDKNLGRLMRWIEAVHNAPQTNLFAN